MQSKKIKRNLNENLLRQMIVRVKGTDLLDVLGQQEKGGDIKLKEDIYRFN